MPSKMSIHELQQLSIKYEAEIFQHLLDSAKQRSESNGQINDTNTRDKFRLFHAVDPGEKDDSERILMSSLFVGLWHWFEHRLLISCQLLQRYKGKSNVVQQSGNYSVEKAKKDLKRLGVKIPADSPTWGDAGKLYGIRNRIVHHGGFLDYNSQPKVRKYAEKKGIANFPVSAVRSKDDIDRLKKDNPIVQLVLTRSFYEEALNTLEQILLQLHRMRQHARASTVQCWVEPDAPEAGV